MRVVNSRWAIGLVMMGVGFGGGLFSVIGEDVGYVSLAASIVGLFCILTGKVYPIGGPDERKQ